MGSWYLEYRIERDRPGLLGDVATLVGMLGINIVNVNSYPDNRRGFLLSGDETQVRTLGEALRGVSAVQLLELRPPAPVDFVSLRHGRTISWEPGNPPIYRFLRDELELLIDFLGEELRRGDGGLYGLRGSPKVGKTEAAIAACVHASKRWIVVSGTIFRQTIRTELTPTELENDCVLLIDAATSVSRLVPGHRQLVEHVLGLGIPKIIEHPDLLLREGWVVPEPLRMVVELRREPQDRVDPSMLSLSPSSFDVS